MFVNKDSSVLIGVYLWLSIFLISLSLEGESWGEGAEKFFYHEDTKSTKQEEVFNFIHTDPRAGIQSLKFLTATNTTIATGFESLAIVVAVVTVCGEII
jgi:hypothetical protein